MTGSLGRHQTRRSKTISAIVWNMQESYGNKNTPFASVHSCIFNITSNLYWYWIRFTYFTYNVCICYTVREAFFPLEVRQITHKNSVSTSLPLSQPQFAQPILWWICLVYFIAKWAAAVFVGSFFIRHIGTIRYNFSRGGGVGTE